MATKNSSRSDKPLSHIFVSYSHRGTKDRKLATTISECLAEDGYSVFVDRKLAVGQDWAIEISQELSKADYLVVLISEASCRSEMVKGEIEMARSQAGVRNGKPRILPVRVSFAGELPYPLNAYLDQIQYSTWRGDGDTDGLLNELRVAISGRVVAPIPSRKRVSTIQKGQPPTYEASIAPTTGALDIEDPYYIARATDERAIGAIKRVGQTIVIKGPRQIGKSSLLVRVVSEAERCGKQIVVIDFQLFGHAERSNSAIFFRRFTSAIANQLEITETLDRHWGADSSDLQKCTRYIETQVLARCEKPLTIAIDEVDIIFGTPFRQDFFGMIRSWHNTRAYPTKRLWKKLDIVLVSSTEPYMFIESPHESPFNVGEILKIEHFTLDNVKELNQRHGQCLSLAEVGKLAALLGGHPYLTRRAFYLLSESKQAVTPDELFSRANDEQGPFGDHLRYYLLRLQEHLDLARTFVDVLHGRSCEDEGKIYRLAGAGLVKRRDKKVVPRCPLYATYFRERLASSV